MRFDEEIGEKFGGWCCWDLKTKNYGGREFKEGNEVTA